MDWATFLAALVAAIISIVLLIVNSTLTLREQAFARFSKAMEWIGSDNDYFVGRGTRVLISQSRSRWISAEDREDALRAIRAAEQRIARRITEQGGLNE